MSSAASSAKPCGVVVESSFANAAVTPMGKPDLFCSNAKADFQKSAILRCLSVGLGKATSVRFKSKRSCRMKSSCQSYE